MLENLTDTSGVVTAAALRKAARCRLGFAYVCDLTIEV